MINIKASTLTSRSKVENLDFKHGVQWLTVSKDYQLGKVLLLDSGHVQVAKQRNVSQYQHDDNSLKIIFVTVPLGALKFP